MRKKVIKLNHKLILLINKQSELFFKRIHSVKEKEIKLTNKKIESVENKIFNLSNEILELKKLI